MLHYPAEALIIIEQARHPRLDEDGDLRTPRWQAGANWRRSWRGVQGAAAAASRRMEAGTGTGVLEGKSVWGGSLSQEMCYGQAFVDGC